MSCWPCWNQRSGVGHVHLPRMALHRSPAAAQLWRVPFGRISPPGDALLELPGRQDAAQLAVGVRLQAAVRPGQLQVVEPDARPHMDAGAQEDDPQVVGPRGLLVSGL